MRSVTQVEKIKNCIFNQINIGDSASYSSTATEEIIKLFALVSGDVNPVHLDAKYAENTVFERPIAHGMWGASLISTILGTKLPGPGTIYLSQDLKFKAPVFVGDNVMAIVRVTEKDEKRKRLKLHCVCRKDDGTEVIEGFATVIAPEAPVVMDRPAIPSVTFNN